MTSINISNDDKERIIRSLQQYLLKEHDLDLGQFEAEFLYDFIGEKMGAFFYNQGLYDAQHLLADKMDALTDAIYEIEKPVNL